MGLYCEAVRRGGIVLLAGLNARFSSPGGSYYSPTPSNIRAINIGSSEGRVGITWDGPSDLYYNVFVDKRLAGRTVGNYFEVSVSPGETHIYEVAPCLNSDEDSIVSPYVRTPKTRSRLSWVRPANTGLGETSKILEYRVYWDAGTGTVNYSSPVSVVDDLGYWSFTYLTPRLLPGVTYKFVVRPVDYAGNELATVVETSVKVKTLPEPVSVSSITYNVGPKTVTIGGT